MVNIAPFSFVHTETPDEGNKMNTVEDDFKSGVLKTPNFFCGQVKTDASQNGDVKNITLSLSSVFSDI